MGIRAPGLGMRWRSVRPAMPRPTHCHWLSPPLFPQSAASTVAHHLSVQLSGLSSRGGAATAAEQQRTPFENLSANASAEVTNRVAEAVAMYRQDLAAIKAGRYKLPWDMTTLSHRQYNPLHVATECESAPGNAQHRSSAAAHSERMGQNPEIFPNPNPF